MTRQIHATPVVRVTEMGSRIEIVCVDWELNAIRTSAVAAEATINDAFGTMNADASPGTKTIAQSAGVIAMTDCASDIARGAIEWLVEVVSPEMEEVELRGN